MEEIKSDQMYMEDLDGWILEENKVVTYKYLSRALDVHVNTAKQMLWSYKESKQGACKGVVYFVSGLTKGSEDKVAETRVSLVKEEKLKETLDSLDKVFSQHVYSIQLSETVSASALYAVDLEVFKEDPMGCCKHVAIKNPLAVPRAAAAPPKIAPGVQMVKEVKKEVKKAGALEGAFAKTKKSSDEPVKSNSVSSVKELKPKVVNSPEKKSLSVNSGSKKAKPGGGIANFFSAKPKAEKPVEKKVEKDSKNEEKENIENKASTEEEENSKRPAPSKKPPVKVETKSFGKKDKEEEDKKSVVDENKKRKRIQVLSDSEEEEEEEKEVEEKIVEPPPPQAQLLHSDSEDEEVIPATPKEKTEGKGGRRRRVKKQVDKTYVDDDGYMVTKKVVESASETDDETEVAPKPEVKKAVNKKETTEEAPAAKKQKVVAPGAKKQQGIASFFTKK